MVIVLWYRVNRFVEKPNKETALGYLEKREFSLEWWNVYVESRRYIIKGKRIYAINI